MTLEQIRDVLAWCSVINIGILLIWFVVFMLAHNFIFSLHGKMFKLSEERFYAIHYTAMRFWKMGILMFNLVPYLALRIVG